VVLVSGVCFRFESRGNNKFCGGCVRSWVECNGLSRVKPVFRLRPPSKGFKGKVKRSYTSGGVTGYRGEDTNKLIKRKI
jgi:hypothetical protein